MNDNYQELILQRIMELKEDVGAIKESITKIPSLEARVSKLENYKSLIAGVVLVCSIIGSFLMHVFFH